MARDKHHEHVRIALEKEGWLITDDPLKISLGDVDLMVDLGAERVIAAERNKEKIAIEIKTLGRISLINAFHEAVGQYRNYRRVLNRKEPERVLYLAIPELKYDRLMDDLFYRISIKEDKIHLLVYNSLSNEIVLWKKQ